MLHTRFKGVERWGTYRVSTERVFTTFPHVNEEGPLPSTCNQYKCVHAVALRLSDFQYLSNSEIRTNFGSHNFSQIQVVNPGSSPTLAKLYFLAKSL